MGTRTVRLDSETEKTLARLRKTTGLTISEVFKRGLKSFEQGTENKPAATAYEIYHRLDLGSGGWSQAPSNEAKSGIRALLRKQHAASAQ